MEISQLYAEIDRNHSACEIVRYGILHVIDRCDPIVGVDVVEIHQVEDVDSECHLLDAAPLATVHESAVVGVPHARCSEVYSLVGRRAEHT